MAIHSSTLAWKIPWTEVPGGPQSMGSQSRTRLSYFTHVHGEGNTHPLSLSLLPSRTFISGDLFSSRKMPPRAFLGIQDPLHSVA